MGEIADYEIENGWDDEYFRDHNGDPEYFEGESYELMKWETKEGVMLLIKDMTDSHIKNTINFMKRTGNNDIIQYQRLCEEEATRRQATNGK